MFNSQITDKNAPINAIRRVVVNNKKKQSSALGPGGVIEEDPEGEDYEEEEEEQHESIQQQGLKMALERVEAEQSSGESDHEQAKKSDPKFKKEDDKKAEKDSKKDKKDKKEKEKKEKDNKKKESELPGYNKDDIDKGKKLMSNEGFRSNLERLRNQFKKAGQPAIPNENAQPQPKVPLLVPPRSKLESDKEITEDVKEYGNQSDVIIREPVKIDDSLKSQVQGLNTRGLKDLSKNKHLTPSVKYDTQAKANPEKKQEETQSTHLNSTHNSTKEGAENQPAPKREFPKIKTDKPKVSEEDPQPKIEKKESKEVSYSEEWNLKNDQSIQNKPKTATPILATKLMSKKDPVQPSNPELGFKKKKQAFGHDSDNSWDEDKNPFD